MRKSRVVSESGWRDYSEERRERWRKKTSAASEKRESAIKKFLGGHVHECVSKSCGKKYGCKNPCNPLDLKSSLCQECFERA